jgi:SAM-dependent methyltransferase
VVVANPRRVRLIAEAERKSDRIDAETLARLGRADSKLLRPVEHRGEAAQQHLALLTATSIRLGSTRYADAVEDDDLELLFELFEDTPRQGPGSVETTRRALRLLPDSLRVERVLDLGCGTGGSTIVLAQDTGAHITAVDIHPPFLATSRARAEEHGFADRITTVVADMANIASLGTGFDLIWAEGSAYLIGFGSALRAWRPLLRPGGCLVVTELVWFVAEPAERAREFFANEYPDMRDEATRIDQARSARYDLLGSFRLRADDWHTYYAGLEVPLRNAIMRRGELEIYAAIRREREIYEACGHEYGYLCLVLQVTEEP